MRFFEVIKKFIITCSACAVLFLINACCTKKDCDSFGDYLTINFYGFQESELDSIYVFFYEADAAFNAPFDSTIVLDPYHSADYTIVEIDLNFDLNTAYKIRLASGREYRVGDFIVKREGCNRCFPKRPESDYYNVLFSYNVNDSLIIGNAVKIRK
ncbi:MAG: hypothetical protein WD048_08610 [Chitinophagales bacterium]